MTDTIAESETSEATEASPRKRGRPRSPEIERRDQAVYEILKAATEGMTRNDVAKALKPHVEGLEEGEEVKTSFAYLSLVRLRDQGKVEKGRGEGNTHVWSVVAE